MSLEALARHFRLDKVPPITALPPTASSVQAAVQANTKAEALLHIYNPHRDSQALKHHPECFEQLRGDYPLRREETAYELGDKC